MRFFTKNKNKKSTLVSESTTYTPPNVATDEPEANTTQDSKSTTIEKKDSPDICEGDDGVSIISKSKSSLLNTKIIKEKPIPSTAFPFSKRGRDIGEETSAHVRKVAEDGPLSFRVLAFLAGVIMMVTSILSIVSDFISFSIMNNLISTYTFMFGCFIVVLEGKMFLPKGSVGGCQQRLFWMARCLQFVWGRGLLYIFAGSLQFSQMTFLNLISGAFMCFVGVISLLVGRSSSIKLTQLRASISDEGFLQRKFKKHDKNGDKALDVLEFQNFITELGLDMDRNELVAAFNEIDLHDTGKVSMKEFKVWWRGPDLNVGSNNV